MTVDDDRAAARAALGRIDDAQRRALAFRGYAAGGSALVVWGCVWLAANVVSQLAPAYAGAVWSIGLALGVAASIRSGSRVLLRASKRRRAGLAWTSVAGASVLAAAAALASSALQALTQTQVTGALSLAAAVGLFLFGLANGPRHAWLGLTLAVAIAAAWTLAGASAQLWFGVAGGGTLVLAGLWLRRA